MTIAVVAGPGDNAPLAAPAGSAGAVFYGGFPLSRSALANAWAILRACWRVRISGLKRRLDRSSK
jgi:hypothetical protein